VPRWSQILAGEQHSEEEEKKKKNSSAHASALSAPRGVLHCAVAARYVLPGHRACLRILCAALNCGICAARTKRMPHHLEAMEASAGALPARPAPLPPRASMARLRLPHSRWALGKMEAGDSEDGEGREELCSEEPEECGNDGDALRGIRDIAAGVLAAHFVNCSLPVSISLYAGQAVCAFRLVTTTCAGSQRRSRRYAQHMVGAGAASATGSSVKAECLRAATTAAPLRGRACLLCLRACSYLRAGRLTFGVLRACSSGCAPVPRYPPALSTAARHVVGA